MNEDRFPRSVVETVAKRAGNICSNPDHQALTTGPAEAEDRSITIGEAAHIFGANPGSARFDPAMSASGRSDITNAIWLCRNCHKLVDADALKYPAPLLFEWRRIHEQDVISRVGKPGDLARQRVLSRELEGFKNCSYLAQQIVIDKPAHWEYKLTAELLRDKMGRVLARWRSLSKGLYTKPTVRIPLQEMLDWHQSRMDELLGLVAAMTELINSEFLIAWGPPGTPGSETEILRVCELLAEVCQRLLDWEEAVRFTTVPSDFKDVKANLIGIGGRMIDKLSIIPVEIAKIFEQSEPTGNHKMHITIDFPEGWTEQAIESMRNAVKAAFGVSTN